MYQSTEALDQTKPHFCTSRCTSRVSALSYTVNDNNYEFNFSTK